MTDNLRKPLQDLLATEKYNVKIEQYKFEGSDWWFDTILTYGHMVLVYLLMSRYKTETNEGNKKKIMYIGGLIVVGWMFLMPHLKQHRVSVHINGVNAYTKDTIIPNEIVSVIADRVEAAEFNEDIPTVIDEEVPDYDITDFWTSIHLFHIYWNDLCWDEKV